MINRLYIIDLVILLILIMYYLKYIISIIIYDLNTIMKCNSQENRSCNIHVQLFCSLPQ